MNDLSVILCSYNEEKNIGKTLKKLLKYNVVKEIIIIDDNSTDKTIPIIESFRSKKIRLYVRKKVRGFASAFIYGIRLSKAKYVLRFDVDMHQSIDLFINKFLKLNKIKMELIIFSRYVKNGRDLRGNFRKISSLFLNKICQIIISNRVKDYTSCIILFKKKILKDIKINNTGYANFIIEFVSEAIFKNKSIIELPFTQLKDTEKNSKSAQNMFIYLKNGFFYILSILKSCLIKLKY